MPLYTVTCRGSLITKNGPIPTGGTVEMSEKDAASLPAGTVALKSEPKPVPIKENEQKPKEKTK